MKDDAIAAFEQLDALLAEGKITDEEYNDLWSAMKRRPGNAGDAAAAPAEKGHACPLCEISLLRKAAIIINGLVIIGCFGLSIAGVRPASIVLGVTSILAYPLALPKPRWLKRLSFVTALSGAGIITLTIVGL